MKKLLFFCLIFLVSTYANAVNFYPHDKVSNFPDNFGDKEAFYQYKSITHDCNLESATSSNDYDFCIALNGEIKNPSTNYQTCTDALGENDSACLYSAGSSIKFKDKLDLVLLRYLEEFIYERYRKLLFDTSDYYKFVEMKKFPFLRVFLNSKGGSVDEALEIGKLIRKYQLSTSVAQGDECLSSCFIIYMSGVSRSTSNNFYLNAQLRLENQVSTELAPVGVHRMYYENKAFTELSADEASLMYRKKYNEIESYLKNVGTPDYLIDKMNNTSSDDMFIITKEVLLNAMSNNNLNIYDMNYDKVFYDRFKGSDIDFGDFIYQEQIKVIYPDYIKKISARFKHFDLILRKAYGQEYWKKAAFIGDADLSSLSEEDCLINGYNEESFILGYCKKYLENQINEQ